MLLLLQTYSINLNYPNLNKFRYKTNKLIVKSNNGNILLLHYPIIYTCIGIFKMKTYLIDLNNANRSTFSCKIKIKTTKYMFLFIADMSCSNQIMDCDINKAILLSKTMSSHNLNLLQGNAHG